MFSLIVAFLIYLIQVGYSHQPWNVSLSIAAKFIFYWNLIFASITIFFFFLMLLGLSTILLKVPFIGVGIYRFNEKIRETGIITFLLKISVLWFISRSFILIGSYILTFELPSRIDMLLVSLALIITGYLIKKQTSQQNNTKVQHHFSIHSFDPRQSREKDITPSEQAQIDNLRNEQ